MIERNREPAPRWVKASAAIAAFAVAVIGVLAAAGHGPWQHQPWVQSGTDVSRDGN
jgi:hypothetical protein